MGKITVETCEIEGLKIITPFASNNASDTIEVATDSGEVLMDKSWNDPNLEGYYSTECLYEVNGNENEILIKHTLSAMTSGSAILRIEMYGNIFHHFNLIYYKL